MNGRFPQWFVLILGTIFGGSLVFITPPYSVPDELAHFLRAYECSQGTVFASRHDSIVGDNLPASLVAAYQAVVGNAQKDADFHTSWEQIRPALDIPLAPARLQYVSFANTALYSPVPYLATAAAMRLGRMAEVGPLQMLYLGRIANLIAYLVLAVAAVHITPVQKWTMALVAIMPMSMFLAASLSADAVLLGLSFLAIALALDLAVGKDTNAGRLLTFGAVFVLLALSKQAYFSLALLFFIISRSKFATRGEWWAAALLIVGLPITASLAWAYSVRFLYVPIRPFVNPLQQIDWIRANPLSYTVAMIKAIYHVETYETMIGYFGWLGARISPPTCLVYWVALFATAILDGGKPLPLGTRLRAAVLAIYAITAAVVTTLIYLSWERVGTKSIEGIQPRYFLPMLPLLLVPLRGGAKLVSGRFSRVAVPICAILVAVFAAAVTWRTLMLRYYL